MTKFNEHIRHNLIKFLRRTASKFRNANGYVFDLGHVYTRLSNVSLLLTLNMFLATAATKNIFHINTFRPNPERREKKLS